MRVTFRAAAFAAAALGFCAVAGFAGPSLASEADNAPTVSYIAHADSTLSVESLGLNDLDDPIEMPAPAEEAAPIATHDQAPAAPRNPLIADQAIDRDGRDGRSLAELVSEFSATETPDAETECLARGVYYESKGESLAGQLTVAEVIINRARSGRFPSTICGVLRQRGQFSFVRGGHIPQPPVGSRDWRIAVAIAQIATQDLADGAAPRALFFHARHARPGWRLTRVATVGNHVFYR